jgi:hypothetical protein
VSLSLETNIDLNQNSGDFRIDDNLWPQSVDLHSIIAKSYLLNRKQILLNPSEPALCFFNCRLFGYICKSEFSQSIPFAMKFYSR